MRTCLPLRRAIGSRRAITGDRGHVFPWTFSQPSRPTPGLFWMEYSKLWRHPGGDHCRCETTNGRF